MPEIEKDGRLLELVEVLEEGGVDLGVGKLTGSVWFMMNRWR